MQILQNKELDIVHDKLDLFLNLHLVLSYEHFCCMQIILITSLYKGLMSLTFLPFDRVVQIIK